MLRSCLGRASSWQMRLGLAYHGFGVEGLRFWVLRAGACVQCTLPVQDNPQGLGMRDGGVGLVLRFAWGKQADGRIFSCMLAFTTGGVG